MIKFYVANLVTLLPVVCIAPGNDFMLTWAPLKPQIMSEIRTVEVMKELLHSAKLDDSCSSGPIQSVLFSTALTSDEYNLFEVSPALADKLIRPGAFTVIELKDEPRKNNTGRAFACTDEETFSIVEAETSNSLLLSSSWWLPPNSTKPKSTSNKDSATQAVATKNCLFSELLPLTDRKVCGSNPTSASQLLLSRLGQTGTILVLAPSFLTWAPLKPQIMSEIRTVEVMKELLHSAKLDDSCSSGPIQSVLFSTALTSDEYNLFEVSPALADKLIRPGAFTVIELKDEPRKNNTGRAFACTDEETFSIVEAETSNSLLLSSSWWLPPNSTKPKSTSNKDSATQAVAIPNTVIAVKKSYYELHRSIAPSLRLLKQYLSTSTYHGPVEDGNHLTSDESTLMSPPLHSRSDLIQAFPCSPTELSLALKRLRACEVDGAIRIMDREYLTQVIRDMFSCADENAWNWRKQGFPYKAVLDSLSSQHEESLLRQIIPLFFSRSRDSSLFSSQGEFYMFPRNSKICQLIGEHLLSVTHSFDMTDFLAVWKAAVPEGLRPKLRKHLTCAGRAYSELPPSRTLLGSTANQTSVDVNSSRFRSISLLCSEDLPDESVEVRLGALFQRCSFWPEAELASYLTELLVSPLDSKKSEASTTTTTSVPFMTSDSDSDFNMLISRCFSLEAVIQASSPVKGNSTCSREIQRFAS
ncbi:hypothetical protein T265_00236 [Opisthorchis viverrini]|uniref:Sister chromatid cohesion protein DCC1 n=1 Tax=Opisthorchis viverrini TaxID=6198 RepID=A0A075A2W9_OPIVI|nr:hypothetical protein T265_00236 [Opisthorchis viverrini]KER34058.1 hypothetical protein T265_00236 [Opisthorchis viverrini]